MLVHKRNFSDTATFLAKPTNERIACISCIAQLRSYNTSISCEKRLYKISILPEKLSIYTYSIAIHFC